MDLRELNKPSKELIARLLWGVICFDGEVTSEEEEMYKKICRELRISDRTPDIHNITSTDIPNIMKEVKRNFFGAEIMNIAAEVINLICADGKISTAEKACVLENMQKEFNISSKDLDDMTVIIEGIIELQNELDNIINKGGR